MKSGRRLMSFVWGALALVIAVYLMSMVLRLLGGPSYLQFTWDMPSLGL